MLEWCLIVSTQKDNETVLNHWELFTKHKLLQCHIHESSLTAVKEANKLFNL